MPSKEHLTLFLDCAGRTWAVGCGRPWGADEDAPAAEDPHDAPSTPCRARSAKRLAMDTRIPLNVTPVAQQQLTADCWSLVMPFLVAEGATHYYCVHNRPYPDDYEDGHYHSVCADCFRKATNFEASDTVHARNVFYGCEYCKQCRVLNVLSKFWRALSRQPILCANCVDFTPLPRPCKYCIETRIRVHQGTEWYLD